MSTLSFSAAAARRSGRSLARLIGLMSLRRSRQSLLELDDRMLRDIGISREQALAEGTRSVWDVNPTWVR
jgi:uncharacterized protein YjiS (DUF1127 family)